MKNHLFFALLLASALCGCSSSQVDEPISVEPFSQKSVFNVSQPAHDDYKSCVKEHPEIFGANCMFFETEEDMLEMYDKVLEMSCTDL